MPFTEDEIVSLLQDAATKYFDGLDTQAKWVNFINIVDKGTVKTFIRNVLLNAAGECDESSVNLAERADDLEALATTVAGL